MRTLQLTAFPLVLACWLCASTSTASAEAPATTAVPMGTSPSADAPTEQGPSDLAQPLDEPEQDDTSDHLRVGALLGIGFPRPLAAEALIAVERILGLGVEYGALPTLQIAGVLTSSWSVAGDVRLFPTRGSFFIGMHMGVQHLSASTNVAVAQLGSIPVSATVDGPFLNPRLGFLWRFDPGIALGLDAGLQIPVATRVVTHMPALASETVVGKQATALADRLGKSWLPTLDLLRIGVLF